MLSLFKLLKTINNNDTVGMFISEERNTELGILIENKEKNPLLDFSMFEKIISSLSSIASFFADSQN